MVKKQKRVKKGILLRETKNFIKKNKKTYFAQVIIIMLGVGFFVGMKVSTLDMKDSMRSLIDDNEFYDIKVNLEFGIEEKDISELSSILKEVRYIEGAYSKDIIQTFNEREYVIRLHSYNPDKKIATIEVKTDEDGNLLGRLPEAVNECVIDYKMYSDGYKIGDVITIDNDLLFEKTMTIVGVIQSPEYLSTDRGSSTTLSAKISYYIYINEANVNSEIYSDLYIKYDTNTETFSEEYDEFMERKELEATYDITGYYKDKYNEIISNMELQLSAAKTEYQLEEARVNAKIDEAEKDIRDKESLLNDAKDMILSAKEIEKLVQEQLNASTGDLKKQLAALKTEVDAAKKELDDYKNQIASENATVQAKIDANNASIATYKKQLATLQSEYAALEAKYNAAVANATVTYTCPYTWASYLSADKTKCCSYCFGSYCSYCTLDSVKTTDSSAADSYKKQMTAKQSEITSVQNKINELETANTKLEAQLTVGNELAKYEAAYNEKKAEYDELNKLISTSTSESELKAYYNKQNAEIQKTINQYEKEIAAAKKELETQKAQAKAALKAAKNEINDSEDLLNNLTTPNSYLFIRKDNTGYSQFISDIEKVNNLATIVPIVFYSIVAFMIVASVSRMLHEERNQIGTLKAIGASDNQIRRKYLIYSISAVIIGSLLGIIIGIIILPLLIYFIYEMLYEFPNYNLIFSFKYYLLASLLAMAVAIVATLFCCHSTFKEKPVFLLKAKQEKGTKGSVFEKIPILWNRLSIPSKVSIKNIFRYKVRMLMTIIGVGGCLALMLTGLSLRSSIAGIIPAQYGDEDTEGVFDVDAQIFYTDLATRTELTEGTEKILALDGIKSGVVASLQNYTTDYGDSTASIYLVSFFDDDYKDYVTLKNNKTGKIVELGDDGVYLTHKMAELAGLKAGDVIKVKNSQQQEYPLVIKGIVTNYFEHYIFMSSEYYETLFGAEPRGNMLMIQLEDDNCDELELSKQINESGIVAQVTFVSYAKEVYEQVMDNLSLLVGVFIVFSVLLIFAVLYNLININIRERTKEIATYKVLGFKTSNVIGIVKRENYVLMFLGIIFGCLAGSVLALIVIKSVEVENMSFIKEITLENYIISIVATALFTMLFSRIINSYVKKINLTEALKGNE